MTSSRPSPNILLIHCHDLGRELTCCGRAGLSTPHLDRFAKQGVTFTQAFSTAPNCSPSRASLMTGMYPHRHGIVGLSHEPHNFRYDDGVRTLPMRLRDFGYATHLFGLQHEGPDPFALGYDHVHENQAKCRCAPVAKSVVEFLGSADVHDRPFFASVGFWEAHRWGRRGFPEEEYSAFAPSAAAALPAVELPAGVPLTPEVEGDLAGLSWAITAADAAVGRILAALATSGLEENTWVIFTTDHGLSFPRAKATLYDAGIEIALLMRWPGGFEGGRTVDDLVGNLDVVPTILTALGRAQPAEVDGCSFWPQLRGRAGSARTELFAEKTYHDERDVIRAIRTSHFKYIRNFTVRNGYGIPTEIGYRERFKTETPRPAEELYQIIEDPAERINLADRPEYADVKAALSRQLSRWLAETADTFAVAETPSS